jgi:hypothetical protein
LQKAYQEFFKDRAVFYSTFPIREQAKKGVWDFNLNAVYLVAILDFEFDSDDVQYIRIVQLKDNANQIFYDKLTFIFIEISKFDKSEEELETGIDKWCYALKNLPNLRKRPKALSGKIFAKLFREAEIARFTEEERMSYEESLKRSRDYQNTINTSFK